MKVPQEPPTFSELRRRVLNSENLDQILGSAFKPTQNGKYRHWEELRYRTPPDELNHEEWWFAIKLARINMAHPLPLTDVEGQAFTYAMTDEVLEGAHRIDRRASGRAAISEVLSNQTSRNRYLINSLIEEAITSSQLEGASTSRRVAKDMIKSGRPPRDKSEKMIFNNYLAMNFVRDHRQDKLTPDLICELHRIITDGTLDDPGAAGRLQTTVEERVKVWGPYGNLLHAPPPAEQLPERLKALCSFANRRKHETFVHPVIKAIIIHFWLAYDHPFADGNGRTARALFYWYMLKRRYWLTQFLTISAILRKAPAKYARSFLYTETDENDLTYFILYHLGVILRAIEELYKYLQRKAEEVREIETLLRYSAGFNHRQIALLGHALRTPDAEYTFKSHGVSHNIVHQTARTDLLRLEEWGLLVRKKIGKAYVFSPPSNLLEKLSDLNMAS